MCTILEIRKLRLRKFYTYSRILSKGKTSIFNPNLFHSKYHILHYNMKHEANVFLFKGMASFMCQHG